MAWISSTTALAIFLVQFLYENGEILTSRAPLSQKLAAIATTFYKEKEGAENARTKEKEQREIETRDFNDVPQGFIYDISSLSPGNIRLARHEEGASSLDDGPSSTEPGTPCHDVAPTRASEDGQ